MDSKHAVDEALESGKSLEKVLEKHEKQ